MRKYEGTFVNVNYSEHEVDNLLLLIPIIIPYYWDFINLEFEMIWNLGWDLSFYSLWKWDLESKLVAKQWG